MENYYLTIPQNWKEVIILITLMALFALPFIFFIKKFIFSAIKHFLSKYISKYTKLLEQFNIYRFLLHSLLSLYLIFWNNIFNTIIFFNPVISSIKDIGIAIYTTFSFTMLFLSIINTTAEIYKTKSINKHLPISLHTQILKTFIISCATIIVISYILNISLKTFFTSLGAVAALLTFIFKDTVTGLLASLQLTSQDIIRIGDRISIPQYNIEGIVEAITITIVTIKNDDNTISTISTSTLLASSMKNSRGIEEAGGRRIQRAIYIDISSIKFCSQPLLEELKNLPYLSKVTPKEFNKDKFKNKVTNIGIFRLYIEEYLKHNNQIHQQGFPFLVRELDPTPPAGLPIELYIFTKAIEGPEYEKLQAEILDHLISILPKFSLKLYNGSKF